MICSPSTDCRRSWIRSRAPRAARVFSGYRFATRLAAERNVGKPDMAEGPANFASIESADLGDDDRLAELYVEAVRRGWWPGGNNTVLDFWCLAEKALQDDKYGTPGRLFHSLIKSKERKRITDGQEQRAQRRMPSHKREALANRAASPEPRPSLAKVAQPLKTEDAEELEVEFWNGGDDHIVYHHSIMMMCFLPQKRLPAHQRDYVVRHGQAALRIEAGALIDPGNVGQFKTLPVPYGSRARMILPYINAYALRNKTRTVDLGRSLREFMARIGLSFDGRRGVLITEQVQALAAAHLVLGVWEHNRSRAHLATIADEVSFWIEKDARQRSLWEPEMVLSQRYYDSITERPVPLDMGHLIQLARSPRRMDFYAWLTYRTALIASGKKVRVRLGALQPVFAPDVHSSRLFKQRLRQDINAVAKVYPEFRASVEDEVLVLEKSPPPVARRGSVLLPNPSRRG